MEIKELVSYIETNKLGTYVEKPLLEKYTTYKTGGVAKLLFEPYNIESLQKFLSFNTVPVFIIGNGSNLILPDENTDRVILKLTHFSNYEVNEKKILTVQAGVNLPKLAFDCVKRGLVGLDYAAGIPGTIGGAIYMNAGAYGSCIADALIEATVLTRDLKIKVLSNEEMNFSYRYSILHEEKMIVLEAKFQLTEVNQKKLEELYYDRLARRKKSQPIGEASAGSVFRNLDNQGAWEVIDKCGLRGKQIGGAMVSNKHCNTIINVGEATSANIIELIYLIKNIVKEELEVDLKIEQIIVQWFDE